MKSTHAFTFLFPLGFLALAPPAQAGPPDAAAALDRAIEAAPSIIHGATGDRKAELMFRLSELYLKKAELVRADAMLAHDTAYVAWVEGGQRGEAPKIEAFLGETNATTRTAYALARRVLDEFPEYSRNDEVLFLLAQTAEALGRADESAEHLATLIRRFPKSAIVSVAWLRLGEHHFAANRLEKARHAYERAHALGEGINRRFALHKLAWCDYNSGEYGAGIEKLQRVVEDPASKDLAAEALRDLTRFYAHVDDVPSALAYFSKYGGEDATSLALKYTAVLDDQGKWPFAVAARKKILARDPSLGEVRAALLASLEKVEHYAEIEQEAAKIARATPNEAIQGTLYAVATELHRRGVESKRDDRLKSAAAVYDAHLALFPAHEQTAEVRFFVGEIAMQLDDPKRAALAYDLVADDEGAGRFRVPAALGAVLAREETGEGLVAACDRYVALAPDAEDAIEIRYRAAQALDEAGDHTNADRRFLALAEAQPKHPLAKTAARRVTARLVDEAKWRAAARTGRAFLDTIGHDAELARQVEGATYKSLQANETKAQQLEGAAKDLAVLEVADAFRRFADDFAESDYADEALLSAALLYSGVGRVDRAMESASLALERYPRSEHAAQTYLLHAELHERIADFATAARLFAQFAHDYPKHAHAPDALINAGLYFVALDHKKAARRVFSRYVDRHAELADAPDVYLKLCATHADRRAAKCYAALAKRWPNAPEAVQLAAKGAEANALRGAGRTREAAKLDAWIVARWSTWSDATRREPTARRVTAAAAFSNAEEIYDRLTAQKIDLKPRSVTQRMRLLNDLVCTAEATGCARAGAFVAILDYQDPDHAVAALTRIGDSYKSTADAMSAAPIPPHLTPEQAELYRSQLASEVSILEARAIEAYELAVNEGRELGIYSAWVVRATAVLHGFDATAWPEHPERPFERVDDLLVSPIRQAENSTISR